MRKRECRLPLPPASPGRSRHHIPFPNANPAAIRHRPLNAAELKVLRAQYEKEGEMVGVQTKFNYAWVCTPPPPPQATYTPLPLSISNSQSLFNTGPRQVYQPRRPAARRPPPVRNLPRRPRAPPRVPLLPRPRQLQARQLRRGPPLQRPAPRQGARQPPGLQPAPAHRRQGC